MKLLLFFLPFLFAWSPVQEDNCAVEEDFLSVSFSYSQDFSNCNTGSNPCATMNLNATGGGIDIWWDFGPYECVVYQDGRNAVVSFDTQAIYNATNQSGYQYIPVTVFTEDYYGNMGSRTRTIRIVVC